MKNVRTKRFLKWVGIAILTPVLLLILLAALLYFPPVQNWAVKRVAAIASEKTGMEISVEHVNLEFPLNLGVEGVRVLRPREGASDGAKDTVADIRKMVVDVQLKPLFRGQVEVDALELEDAILNTTDFISDTQIKGRFGKLAVESHGIDLKGEQLRVNMASLENADLDVILSDTAAVDTTESTNKWRLLVDELNVRKSDVRVHLPGDTLQVSAYLGDVQAKNGTVDFGKGEYKVGRFDWKDGRFAYDDHYAAPTNEGMDYSHISLHDINMGLDSISYTDKGLLLRVRETSMKEKSGVELRELSGEMALESKGDDGLSLLKVKDLRARTSESRIDGQVVMDLNTFDDKNPGKMHATVDASIGKQDIVKLAGDLPQQFKRQWPNQPLTVKGVVSGNMQQVKFDGLHVNLPGALNARLTGSVTHPTDFDHMIANVDLDAKADNLDFLTAFVPKDALGDVRIPKGIGVKGRVNVLGKRYKANITATEGGGIVKADVDFDAATTTYVADVKAQNLNLRHFVPSLDAGPFTGNVQLKGSGTDILSPRTRIQAKAEVTKFRFAGYDLSGMKGNVNVSNGRIYANVDSRNKLSDGNIRVDGLSNTKMLRGTVTADLRQVDLYRLGVMDRPMTAALCLHVDLDSDMKEYHKVKGMVSDIVVSDSANVYRPDDVVFDLFTRRDTIHAVMDCGDFHLRADASSGFKQLSKDLETVANRLADDVKEKKIDQMAFRKLLPSVNLYLKTGNDNFLAKLLERKGYSFDSAYAKFTVSSVTGLNGRMIVNRLMADSIQLDTVRFSVESDSTSILYRGQIRNNKDNPQYVFNALFNGHVFDNGLNVDMSLFDADDRLGAKLGAQAEMADSGIIVRMVGDDPILGYKQFKVNEDNYIFLANNQRVTADFHAEAADGQGVEVYSNDGNPEALQDLTIGLHRFDLKEVLSVVPYAPNITGVMDGDFHLIKNEDKDLSLSSALSVKDMTYEQSPMGNISTEFVYIPKGDGTHFVDGLLYQDDEEVGSIVGTYNPQGQGNLDAVLTLTRLPLSLANGFIPDQIVGFQGYADGNLSVKGALSQPQVNGELDLDSCYLVSEPYGLSLRFSNAPVRIVGSNLTLQDYALYAYNENPVMVNGNVDFSQLDHVMLNLRLNGNKVQVIKAKETPKSVVFGTGIVNLRTMLSGDLDQLRMRGRVEVLSSTDLSYILRDSPLTTDNQLDELVKFVDFSDTTSVVVTRPPLGGFSMNLTVDVSDGVHIMAYLNADRTNYVDLMGGGTLRLSYDNVDELRLTGKYTLSDGTMKYSLPVIPLRTFTIKDGSYIEFTGDPMNPRLNITATEKVRAPVSNGRGVGESKNFECGVVITKTLNDMGLEFIIDAEDQQLQDELQSMGAENRGKLAVSMLATGMYVAEGNADAFSMNSALGAFLNSQISDITGKALRTVDLSVGLDNSTDANGDTYTDYSFKFAKRFWNNRLKVSVGSKVTSGSDIDDYNRSFFDNFDVEYRLDDTANKFITGFYRNNVYDWLDGYTQQYGVGFTWRRKLSRLIDIFRFKNTDNQQQNPNFPMRPFGAEVRTDSLGNGENGRVRKVENEEVKK